MVINLREKSIIIQMDNMTQTEKNMFTDPEGLGVEILASTNITLEESTEDHITISAKRSVLYDILWMLSHEVDIEII